MNEYTKEEADEALKSFKSSIGKCEKVLLKLKDGSWQKKWTERQLEAYYISVGILERKADGYTKEQLSEAARTLKELVAKCDKTLDFKEGSPQKTLTVRRIKAFLISLSLIDACLFSRLML